MKYTFLLAALAAGATLTSMVWGQQGQETYVLWGDPQKGRKFYAEHSCPACHAILRISGRHSSLKSHSLY
jgi:hypothetical protein